MKKYELLCITGAALQSITIRKQISDTGLFPVDEYLPHDFKLPLEQSHDASYAYSACNPVKVGGGLSNGISNKNTYLNKLSGPKGEKISYHRLGCITRPTKYYGHEDKGVLDMYMIDFIERPEPVILYIDMYQYGELLVPLGFSSIY